MQKGLITLLSALAGGLFCFSLVAEAQAPPAKHDDEASEEVIELDTPGYFEPGKYGMTILTTPSQLGSALESLCPKGKMAKSKTMCAFISYAPTETSQEAYQQSLRPIFRASGGGYWTFIGGTLTLASVATLAYATDLTDANEPGRKDPYPATALVGFETNEQRCLEGLQCVDLSFFTALVNDTRILTSACVDEIWNKRGGSSDAGSQNRCRFDLKR